MKKAINKLVRDNIPSICKGNGQIPDIKILDDDEEYTLALHKKLQEEVSEYLESREIDELADIIEVVEALAESQGASLEEVMNIKQLKRNANGGLKSRIFLISVDD